MARPPPDELDHATTLEDPALDPELDDTGWASARPRPGVAMRHPLVLVFILAGALFLLVKSTGPIELWLKARAPTDCGTLMERPLVRAEGREPPPLIHESWCRLEGVVESLSIFATGEVHDTQDLRRRDVGRKYYVKLNGADVFAVLDGGHPEVVEYRIRRGNLFGYEISGPGRLIELSKAPGFQETERFLRARAPAAGGPLYLYDTTEDPGDRWPYLVIAALMLLTAALALYGLGRMALNARRAA
jgi:hypothetical protein